MCVRNRPLYTSFGCPWSDTVAVKEPVFTLPACYTTPNPVALKTGHLEKFRLETLLYIFYTMPRDVLQWHAAQELYNRKWKYHKVPVCVSGCCVRVGGGAYKSLVLVVCEWVVVAARV